MLENSMPPTMIDVPGSELAEGWAEYKVSEETWVITKRVFAIRTGKGDYAKIWLENFLDYEDKSGTVTMNYIYPVSPTLHP
jgi:hypothetical protein